MLTKTTNGYSGVGRVIQAKGIGKRTERICTGILRVWRNWRDALVLGTSTLIHCGFESHHPYVKNDSRKDGTCLISSVEREQTVSTRKVGGSNPS